MKFSPILLALVALPCMAFQSFQVGSWWSNGEDDVYVRTQNGTELNLDCDNNLTVTGLWNASRQINLPSHPQSIRITTFDAAGGRTFQQVLPVYRSGYQDGRLLVESRPIMGTVNGQGKPLIDALRRSSSVAVGIRAPVASAEWMDFRVPAQNLRASLDRSWCVDPNRRGD